MAENPPLGIQLLSIFGILFAVASMFNELDAVFGGGVGAGVGAIGLVLGVIQIVVFIALIDLKSWAWPAAIVLFTFGTLLHFIQGEMGSSFVSILILFYIYVQKPQFQTERVDGTT